MNEVVSVAVLDRVRQAAAGLFDLPVSQIDSGTSAGETEAWDSLQHLNLVLELESAFGTRFSLEELERMDSIGEIARLIQEKIGEN